VAVLDTNCDPDEVDYPVPGNDDAIRSAALLTKVVAEAVAEGLLARSGGLSGGSSTEEPLAEWERELLASGAAEAAAAEAAASVETAAPVEAAPADAIAETEAGAEALLEVQADSAEGVAEIVPNEQVSAVAPGSNLN